MKDKGLYRALLITKAILVIIGVLIVMFVAIFGLVEAMR